MPPKKIKRTQPMHEKRAMTKRDWLKLMCKSFLTLVLLLKRVSILIRELLELTRSSCLNVCEMIGIFAYPKTLLPTTINTAKQAKRIPV